MFLNCKLSNEVLIRSNCNISQRSMKSNVGMTNNSAYGNVYGYLIIFHSNLQLYI